MGMMISRGDDSVEGLLVSLDASVAQNPPYLETVATRILLRFIQQFLSPLKSRTS